MLTFGAYLDFATCSYQYSSGRVYTFHVHNLLHTLIETSHAPYLELVTSGSGTRERPGIPRFIPRVVSEVLAMPTPAIQPRRPGMEGGVGRHRGG